MEAHSLLLYYSVFYIPITVATQGRSRPGALSSYISLAVVGSQSQFKLQLHHSYDDNNLSCLVQDSLLLVLLRLPSSVPSFSSFYGRCNLVFSAFLFSLAKLQALRFKLQLCHLYNSNDVPVWFKTLSFTYFYDYL